MRPLDEWHESAVFAADTVLKYIVPGDHFTMGRLRDKIASMVGEPRHPNCWGPVMRQLRRQGKITPTFGTAKSMRPASHRRLMQVWQRT